MGLFKMLNNECEYCDFYSKTQPDLKTSFVPCVLEQDLEGAYITIVLEEIGKFENDYLAINYCPMCGRKL